MTSSPQIRSGKSSNGETVRSLGTVKAYNNENGSTKGRHMEAMGAGVMSTDVSAKNLGTRKDKTQPQTVSRHSDQSLKEGQWDPSWALSYLQGGNHCIFLLEPSEGDLDLPLLAEWHPLSPRPLLLY